MQQFKEMIIELELDDTEAEAKAKLDSIETQLNRILNKQAQIGIDYIKEDYDRELKARGLVRSK